MRREPVAGQATRAERARFADRTMSNMIESLEAPLLRLEKAAGKGSRALMEVYRQVPPPGLLHCCGRAGLPGRIPPPRILPPRMHLLLVQVGERYRNCNDSLGVITSDGRSSMHNGETVQQAIDRLNVRSTSSLKVISLTSCPGNTIPTSACTPPPSPTSPLPLSDRKSFKSFKCIRPTSPIRGGWAPQSGCSCSGRSRAYNDGRAPLALDSGACMPCMPGHALAALCWAS